MRYYENCVILLANQINGKHRKEFVAAIYVFFLFSQSKKI